MPVSLGILPANKNMQEAIEYLLTIRLGELYERFNGESQKESAEKTWDEINKVKDLLNLIEKEYEIRG